MRIGSGKIVQEAEGRDGRKLGSSMRFIGRYRIVGALGRGGMGRVYRVWDPDSRRLLALKILEPHPHLATLLGEAQAKKLFLMETEVMEKLHHPHLATVLDRDVHEGRPFFVMEYYCRKLAEHIGEQDVLERPTRPLPAHESFRIIREILGGLEAMHRLGLIHRDVKPANVLLSETNAVKVIDFGLSKIPGVSFPKPRQLVVGTPYYAAPEQERNPDEATPASDLYSVGVILFRLLTGVLPSEPSFVALPHPFDGPSWKAFFRKACAASPTRRYQSAAGMRRALAFLEKTFDASLERACRLWQEEPLQSVEKVPCRHEAAKVSRKDAQVFFELDSLWRPRVETRNAWRVTDTVLFDETTGLWWQRDGSPERLTWPQAREYVGDLRRAAFGGRTDWRLPTVSELATVLKRPRYPETFCMEPVFSRRIRRFWSADRCSFRSAWYASSELGYIAVQDFSCRTSVRAVAGPHGENLDARRPT